MSRLFEKIYEMSRLDEKQLRECGGGRPNKIAQMFDGEICRACEAPIPENEGRAAAIKFSYCKDCRKERAIKRAAGKGTRAHYNRSC